MNYWLDSFTGETWREFRDAGARVSGFRRGMRGTVARIKPGDILLCYVTGVKRWVGALKVLGRSKDTRKIWSVAEFPVRLEVRPLIMLDVEYGVPMEELEGHVEFYAGPKDRGGYKGFVRKSLNLFRNPQDGAFILDLLRKAERDRIPRPVDQRKLGRKPYFVKATRKVGRKDVETIVSIPREDEEEVPAETEAAKPETVHTEIQHCLLELGAEMGYDTWVARNDRSKTYNGQALGELPRVLNRLPNMFNEATDKTVEMIDVLWLKGRSIEAAFEIECTTSIYSGLLRMSDLLALQPNINIDLYIVAPKDRRTKVERELLRPTFKLRKKPLAEVCGFLSIEKLVEKVKQLKDIGVTGSLKAQFLRGIAEYFTREDAGD